MLDVIIFFLMEYDMLGKWPADILILVLILSLGFLVVKMKVSKPGRTEMKSCS